MSERSNSPETSTRRLLRNFLIEIGVYGILIVFYFLVVLRFLNDFLTGLFDDNLLLYAFLGLLLILAQGVLLDFVTSFLLDQIKLERFHED